MSVEATTRTGGAESCGHMTACGSWWHGEGDEPRERSQIFEFLGRVRVRIGCLASTYVALAADGLVAVVLGGKGLQGRLNDTTTEAEH